MVFVWLFLAVPWVCLRFVIVVLPDHTHLLFLVNFRDYFIKKNKFDVLVGVEPGTSCLRNEQVLLEYL